jgi:hypothetical protein
VALILMMIGVYGLIFEVQSGVCRAGGDRRHLPAAGDVAPHLLSVNYAGLG